LELQEVTIEMRYNRKIVPLTIQTIECDINVPGGSKMILRAESADSFKNGCEIFIK
jgi:hypothetical protein